MLDTTMKKCPMGGVSFAQVGDPKEGGMKASEEEFKLPLVEFKQSGPPTDGKYTVQES